MLAFHCDNISFKKYNLQGILETFMLTLLLFFERLVPGKQKENIADIIYLIFHYSGSLIPQIIIHQ